MLSFFYVLVALLFVAWLSCINVDWHYVSFSSGKYNVACSRRTTSSPAIESAERRNDERSCRRSVQRLVLLLLFV